MRQFGLYLSFELLVYNQFVFFELPPKGFALFRLRLQKTVQTIDFLTHHFEFGLSVSQPAIVFEFELIDIGLEFLISTSEFFIIAT